MDPYNQSGRQSDQPMQGGTPPGQSEGAPAMGTPSEGAQQQQQPLSELSVSTPTLRWVSINHPQVQIPLGPDDYVLDTVYNHQIDTWEVLVILQPREEEDEEDD